MARTISRPALATLHKGKANKALVALIAKTAGVAKSAVSLVSGDTQREKILRIEGDPEDIISRLEQAGTQ